MSQTLMIKMPCNWLGPDAYNAMLCELYSNLTIIASTTHQTLELKQIVACMRRINDGAAVYILH